jgi:hypothetical protein
MSDDAERQFIDSMKPLMRAKEHVEELRVLGELREAGLPYDEVRFMWLRKEIHKYVTSVERRG